MNIRPWASASALAAILTVTALASIARGDMPAGTAGWKTITGGPGTGCATDATPYEFYVHEGDSRRVAVWFEGGGACWNTHNCGLDGQPTFDPSVDDNDRPWLKGAGIFEVANPNNPLREFTIVFAPYCTADVHIGAADHRFETADGKHLDVHYRGLANSKRVMDWVMQQYADPKIVFVAGSSAGAIPSPIFASQFARHYQKARVVELGDAAGAYRTVRVSPQLDLWGATQAVKQDQLFGDLSATTANFEDFYRHAATVPNLQLAQVNTIEDRVQLLFLAQLGHQVASLAPLLSGNLAELRQTDKKLRTYTIPGGVHMILPRPDLYTTTVDDVPFTQWLDDLVNGRSVGNVGESLLTAPADRLQ